MDIPTTLLVLGCTERSAMIARSVHGLLIEKGQQDLARLVLSIYEDAVEAAELLGRDLGVEVLENLFSPPKIVEMKLNIK